MDFWLYFGFVYGILFDGHSHHTKFTKKSTKTRKRKNWLDGTHVVPSPVPHAKFSKISEMHEKGDRGGLS